MYPAGLYASWKYGGMVAQAIKRGVDMCSEEVGDLRDWRHNLPGRDCCVVPTPRLRGQFATFTKLSQNSASMNISKFRPRQGAQRRQAMARSAQYPAKKVCRSARNQVKVSAWGTSLLTPTPEASPVPAVMPKKPDVVRRRLLREKEGGSFEGPTVAGTPVNRGLYRRRRLRRLQPCLSRQIACLTVFALGFAFPQNDPGVTRGIPYSHDNVVALRREAIVRNRVVRSEGPLSPMAERDSAGVRVARQEGAGIRKRVRWRSADATANASRYWERARGGDRERESGNESKEAKTRTREGEVDNR
ncbi:hypothetical protein EDB85DRAFT_1900308 [Lactarius pseudohatsudake]|nr:hypothetical protein EDB85DRAFT_1900308 [Lactarius pseudohatsudake]